MAEREHKCERYCLWHCRIPWVLAAVDVTGPARVVLWVMAVVHANGDTGLCWPGVVALARESGLSRWTVSRAVGDLVNIGAVEVVERLHRKSTLYRVVFETDPETIGCNPLRKVGDKGLPTKHWAAWSVGGTVHALGAESGAEPVITKGDVFTHWRESLDINEENAWRLGTGAWEVGPFRFPN